MKAGWEIFERDGVSILSPCGDWVALEMGDAMTLAAKLGRVNERPRHIDCSGLGRVDTTGALGLLRLLAANAEVEIGARADLVRLFGLVKESGQAPKPAGPRTGFFARFGKQVVEIGADIYRMLVFTGHMVTALGRTSARPARLRLTPLFAMMQEAGINALPIAFIMTFFIGAVIALVGTNLLTSLGVEVFTVQLVGVAILREFGVVITAILLAGRSASAFAAQIGSMRMNQETDAMQVMGIDQFDALVVPRIIAAVLMMPLITFVADMGGVIGGLFVSWLTIDISPAFFLQRMADSVSLRHFWIGMCKAPFLGLVIAGAGCRHGLLVGGDVQSLGHHVTSAVVQSVFLIIMFDALFAVIFMVLDL